MACGGMRDAQGTHYGKSFAAAVSDHGDPVHSQQKGAAMLGVIKAFFDAFEVAD